MSIGRHLNLEEVDRQREALAVQERVHKVVQEALAAEFGVDNATHYEHDRTTIGVKVDGYHLVHVKVGNNNGEFMLRPRPDEAPSLLFFDGHSVFRIDVPLQHGGAYDRRTRALMHALLNVASEHLDEMEHLE